jgi:hypothetical protein
MCGSQPSISKGNPERCGISLRMSPTRKGPWNSFASGFPCAKGSRPNRRVRAATSRCCRPWGLRNAYLCDLHHSSERLCAVNFGASCGSALAVVPASVLGELRLSNVFLRAVYCAAGCGGAFARRRSSTLLLPEQLASSTPKMETTRMRIMTLSRGNRSITVRGFFGQHLYGRSTSRLSSELRLYHVA